MGSGAFRLEEKKLGQLCEVMVSSLLELTQGSEKGRTELSSFQVAALPRLLLCPRTAPQTPVAGRSRKGLHLTFNFSLLPPDAEDFQLYTPRGLLCKGRTQKTNK